MYLENGGRSLEQWAGESIQLAGGATRTWYPGQPLQEILDPRIRGTRFPDGPIVHSPAVRRILAQAATQPPNGRGWGGKKVRDHATWGLPELQLLTRRALVAFCIARAVGSAHVVDRWANVIEQGDFSTPHSHYDSEGAAVYFLEPGVEPGGPPAGGEFELIDPRIPACCPNGPERPTRGIMPDLVPGVLLLFPAQFLHYVRPYLGRRQRITLAWNISAGPAPANLRDPAEEVPVIRTRQE